MSDDLRQRLHALAELAEGSVLPAAGAVRTVGDRRTQRRRLATVVACASAVSAVTVGIAALAPRADTPPAGTSPAPATTPSPATTASPGPAAVASPSSSPHSTHSTACTPADLDPRPYYGFDGAAGTAGATVVVHNISGRACRLTGPPKLEGVAAATGRRETIPITLQGAAASYLVPSDEY